MQSGSEDHDGIKLDAMPDAIVRQILLRLDHPADVIAASSTCRHLRSVGLDVNSGIWKRLCQRRWSVAALNVARYAAGSRESKCDYRCMFLEDNGWRPRSVVECPPRPVCPDLQAASVSFAPDGSPVASVVQTTAAAAWVEIREWQPMPLNPGRRSWQVLRRGTERFGFPGARSAALTVTSIDAEAGIVGIGCVDAGIGIYRVPPRLCEDQPADAPVAALAEHQPEAGRYPVTCMHSAAGHLYALWDRVEKFWGEVDLTEAGAISVMDVASGQINHILREVLYHYELCTFLPVPGTSGNEVLAASVKLPPVHTLGQFCGMCYEDQPAAVCHHQRRSAAAAVSLFDLRSHAPGGMVQRFALPHRSLYPHMQLAREHFLFLSHAGTPFAVWDRRQMSTPVYEQPRLDPAIGLNHSCYRETEEECARPGPSSGKCAAFCVADSVQRTAALHLHCNDGLLLGRADNGVACVWQLDSILGWQDGSLGRLWREAGGADGGHMDESELQHSPAFVSAALVHPHPQDGGVACSWMRRDGWISKDTILAVAALDEYDAATGERIAGPSCLATISPRSVGSKVVQ